MAKDPKYTPEQTAAHYRAMARAVETQREMAAGTGGNKPPRRGCFGVLILFAGSGILVTYAVAQLVSHVI